MPGQRRPSHGVIAFFLAGLLVVAPLFYAGNRPVPLLLLQLGSIALGAALALGAGRLGAYPSALRVALALFAILPLLYLIPLPYSLWAALPGYALYDEVIAGVGGSGGWRSISLLPDATQLAALSLLLPAVVLWAVLSLPVLQVQRLVVLVCLMAAFQAALVVVQFGGPTPVNQMYSGTYANRNHLAGFLNLCLPVIFASLVLGIGGQSEPQAWRVRLLGWASPRGFIRVFSAALALLLMLGLIFSQSRAGIALMLLGIILITVLLAPRLGGLRAHWGIGSVLVITLGCALAIGLLPVLQRFGAQEVLHDGRWTLFGSTLQGIHTFFPLGSGPGTFPAVYPRFQPPDLALTINHAHNDYLEWLFEAGLPAAVLLLLFLGFYGRAWLGLLAQRHWMPFQFIQAGSGVGLLLLLLHSLVDFNLRIPANTIYAAFWLGVFWHDGWQPHHLHRHEHRPSEPVVTPEPVSPAVVPTRNPFLD